MKYTWIAIVGLLAFSLMGCSTVYEGKYDFNDGWREAKVIQIGSSDEIKRPQFSDCRKALLPNQPGVDKFVVLSYKHLTRPRMRVVPLKQSDSVRPGDLVYMNVLSCDVPLVLRGKQS